MLTYLKFNFNICCIHFKNVLELILNLFFSTYISDHATIVNTIEPIKAEFFYSHLNKLTQTNRGPDESEVFIRSLLNTMKYRKPRKRLQNLFLTSIIKVVQVIYHIIVHQKMFKRNYGLGLTINKMTTKLSL